MMMVPAGRLATVTMVGLAGMVVGMVTMVVAMVVAVVVAMP